jgi:hypothetical protein
LSNLSSPASVGQAERVRKVEIEIDAVESMRGALRGTPGHALISENLLANLDDCEAKSVSLYSPSINFQCSEIDFRLVTFPPG